MSCRRRVRPLLFATVGLIAALTAAACGDPAQPIARDAVYGTAPTYRLTDQNGRTVSSRAFAGKVQVVTFLFPYCTTHCPLEARDLALIQHQIRSGPLHGRVQLVSFNVDPAGSGPAQLRAFIAQYGGQPANPDWEYLTGTPAQIRRVVTGGFHIYYQRISIAAENAEIAKQKAGGNYTPQPEEPNALAHRAHVDYDIEHEDYVEILRPDGQIATMFNQAATLTANRLLTAMQAVLAGRPVPPQPAD